MSNHWLQTTVLCAALGITVSAPGIAHADDIDRPGIGDWCYNPIHDASAQEKAAFVADISPAAIAAERKWGIPAPMLAGIAIGESGYGLVRLAIKSNNILSFKWANSDAAAGLVKYTLWCQPTTGPHADPGNNYPAFPSRAAAIDFVASRLKLGAIYAAVTAQYQSDLGSGVDRQTAAARWLKGVSDKHYNYQPSQWYAKITGYVNNPVDIPGKTLWSLRP